MVRITPGYRECIDAGTNVVKSLHGLSKPFTAMSVLLAAERGQLSLNDDVLKYLPE
jgi:hypothetical protein